MFDLKTIPKPVLIGGATATAFVGYRLYKAKKAAPAATSTVQRIGVAGQSGSTGAQGPAGAPGSSANTSFIQAEIANIWADLREGVISQQPGHKTPIPGTNPPKQRAVKSAVVPQRGS